MREILFRGKRKDNGEWCEGFYTCVANLHYIATGIFDSLTNGIINTRAYKVDPETVGQYTGLTDKNGMKIFEGDIVKNTWCFISSASVVRYGEYSQPFNDIHTKHIGFYIEHTGENKDTYRKDLGFFADRCEVIGNLYDNPELLEVKQNG